jgi:hypothetical protein
MSSLPFDPYRAEWRGRWHNRWQHWRADGRQLAFHALALAALVMLLSLPLRDALLATAPLLRGTLERWPLALAAVAGSALTLQQVRALQALQARDARHWLVAQPVAARVLARRRRDTVLLRLIAHLVLGGSLLWVAGAGPRAVLGYSLCAAAAGAIAPALARRLGERTRRQRPPLDPRLRDAGVGRLWRWQKIEAGVGLRGPRLALGLWAWLLVPIGSGLGVVLALATAGMLSALLATAWRRSLQVLPRAQAWLGPQPLPASALLRATVGFPAAVLVAGMLLSAAALTLLGAPRLAFAAAAGVLVLGSLHYACAAAERARPRRIALTFGLHLVVLLAVAQALPPLLLASAPLQLSWLLRQALRR